MNDQKNKQTPIKSKRTKEEVNIKFEELYQQSQRKIQKLSHLKEQRQRLRQEAELKECTFQPKINQQIVFNGTKTSSFIKREQDWLNRKDKKISELVKLTDKKAVQNCSFRPTISSKSIEVIQSQSKPLKNNKTNIVNRNKVHKNTYRELHKMKQKINSPLNLLTQKRYEERLMNSKEKQDIHVNDKESSESSDRKKQILFNSIISKPDVVASSPVQKNAIKIDEQDTLNSVSSFDMKTQRKEVLKQEEKNTIMIFEGQFEEEKIDQNEHKEIQHQTEQNNDFGSQVKELATDLIQQTEQNQQNNEVQKEGRQEENAYLPEDTCEKQQHAGQEQCI